MNYQEMCEVLYENIGVVAKRTSWLEPRWIADDHQGHLVGLNFSSPASLTKEDMEAEDWQVDIMARA